MEITKTEFQVMEVIWKLAPCQANEIITRLNKKESWHEKTVKTLLGRLVKKGALDYEKDGRSYVYSPLIAKDEFLNKESHSFIHRLFKGRLSPLVATFAKTEQLTQQDVAELKKIIADWESKQEGK